MTVKLFVVFSAATKIYDNYKMKETFKYFYHIQAQEEKNLLR